MHLDCWRIAASVTGRLALLILLHASLSLTPRALADVPLKLQTGYVNQLDFKSLGDGEYQITTTGNDGYAEFALPDVDNPATVPVLGFEYFSVTGIHGIEVRHRALRGDWVGPIDAGSLSISEGWTDGAFPLVEPGRDFWNSGNSKTLRIDFGQAPEAKIRLRNIRLRSYTPEELALLEGAEERRRIKVQSANRIREYIRSEKLDSQIEQVFVDDHEILVRGFLPEAYDSSRQDVKMVTLGPSEQSIYDKVSEAVSTFEVPGKDRRFEVRLNRFAGETDRLLNRWQLVIDESNGESDGGGGGYRAISRACYATHISLVDDSEKPIVRNLRNAKGLGGVSPVFGLDELSELGVDHITLNVVVTDLIHDREIPGGESFEYDGRRWWIQPGRLTHLDQATRYAAEHNIVAAAIILLPQRSKDIIVHPASTSSGTYAMPNLEDSNAAAKYAAVLHMMAKRYSDKDRGRIDHWIMHNEIDFGWIWTNMGEQPLELFMDHYVRSMRIAFLQARQHNPHARVFISLTHHWNVDDDTRWRTYSPRKLLEYLAQLSVAEGDFGWGIAYHPYPQNLFNPRTWNDRDVTDNFDTRLITMKNIQVLERFLRQEHLLGPDGRIREVLLSEQGYHTDGYGTEAQRLQAAAILYTWDRLRATDFVLAYDYHRWVDAAEEGGLLLGLRTVGSPNKIAGEKKLGWEVYRDLGTEAEAKWRNELESIYKVENRKIR